MSATPPDQASVSTAEVVEEALVSTDGAAGAELVAESFGEYMRAWVARVRHGESGMLPVLLGMVAIVLIFWTQTPIFLSAGNITNLLVQGSTFVLLGMAEIFVLLLGEIDLSVGYVAGVGAVLTVAVSTTYGMPWWVAILTGLVGTAFIGALQGFLVTRLRIPSFVVTLGGLLGWEGVVIFLVDHIGGSTGGTLRITNNVLNDLVNGNLDPTAGWIVMALSVAAYAVVVLSRDRRRRAHNLAAPPMTLTLLKIATIAVAGVLLLLVCNANRGVAVVLEGVPWVIPIVVAVLVLWTFLLTRTRYGRHVYAVGGNAEAARRAGINLAAVRLVGFTLAGLTAGLGGIIYASRLGSISNNIDGGTLVLYAVAAAVIGGTSLFGGRGKMLHALVGGIVIATIYNGMGLLNMSAAVQYMVTALVLIAAVAVDAIARRGRSTS